MLYFSGGLSSRASWLQTIFRGKTKRLGALTGPVSSYGWDSQARDTAPRGFQVTNEGEVILVADYPASKQG